MKTKITLSFLVVLFCTVSVFSQKNVIYVQGNATPNVSDAYLIAALTTAGYTVTAKDDDDATTEAAVSDATTNLVVISSTVGGSKVTKFAWVDKPIIVWEGATYLAYGLAGVNGGGFDNTLSLAINLTSNTHPLQTGFSVGDNVIFTGTATAGTFSQFTFYAGPTKPAIRLATLSSNLDLTKGAWVLFEKGTELSPNTAGTIVGYPADGLSVNTRIIVPFSNDFFATPNDLGLKLFMNSAEYALTGNVKAALSKNTISNNSFYPIPAKNMIYVKDEQVKSISIYNTLGSEVLKANNNLSKGVDISNLPAGSYIIKASVNNGTLSSKLIKE